VVRNKGTTGEKIFSCFNALVMILLITITAYPILYVLFASFSDSIELAKYMGPLYRPLGFSLAGYQIVLRNPNILIGYKNTIFYVAAGTLINLSLSSLGAFVLSRKNYYFKKPFMVMILITMYFSGGLIPRFLLVNNLGLLDTVWALLLPNAINTWNLIIMRTSFQSIPADLEDSARIDGANEFLLLFRIILPLSSALLAVMALFYGVGHWNSWFDAMIFIRNRKLYPLQLFLREILLENSMRDMGSIQEMEDFYNRELVKYCTIMVSTLPILCMYPFLQRYFVKGVMLGALKG
jgi:putative aldouronate transport system permease protein